MNVISRSSAVPGVTLSRAEWTRDHAFVGLPQSDVDGAGGKLGSVRAVRGRLSSGQVEGEGVRGEVSLPVGDLVREVVRSGARLGRHGL